MKKLRSRPFKGKAILSSVEVRGAVSINTDLEIADGCIPSRHAAFLLLYRSLKIEDQAEQIRTELYNGAHTLPWVFEHYPHLLCYAQGYRSSLSFYATNIPLVLSDGHGWWQMVMRDPMRFCRPNERHVSHEIDFKKLPISLFRVLRGSTSIQLGNEDGKLIRAAIRASLDGL